MFLDFDDINRERNLFSVAHDLTPAGYGLTKPSLSSGDSSTPFRSYVDRQITIHN